MATRLTKEEYDKEKELLDAALASSKKYRNETYERDTSEERADAEKALREKYISERIAKKQLPQVAAAKGLSGGYVKSAFAKRKGDYSAAAEKIMEERDKAIAKLTETYLRGDEKDEEKYAKSIESLKRRYSAVLGSNGQRNPYILVLKRTK